MGDYRIVTMLGCSRSDRSGDNITAEDFAGMLSLSAEDTVTGTYSGLGRWRGSSVEFSPVLLSEFEAAEEPTEVYTSAVRLHLLSVAAFLDRQSTSTFDHFREAGLHVYIYLEVRMDQDQMQLNLPVKFLASCARLGLGIEMISNDISMAELEPEVWG